MSVPVVENIAANILTAIDAITTANSFNQDLNGFRPVRSDYSDVSPENGTVLIVQESAEPVDGAVNTREWNQRFWLQAIVKDSDSTTTAIDTRINQVAGDIIKKLMEDHTRGGYAIDTAVAAVVPFNVEAFTGVAVGIDIRYRSDWDDPFTQA